MKLEGKVAVITEASRGIGRAIAYCFAEEGADLALCSRSIVDMEEIAEEIKKIGQKVVPVQGEANDAI